MLQKYIYSLINCVTGYVEDEKIDGKKAKLYRPIKDLKYSFYSWTISITKELLELQVLPEYRWSMRLRVTHSFY